MLLAYGHGLVKRRCRRQPFQIRCSEIARQASACGQGWLTATDRSPLARLAHTSTSHLRKAADVLGDLVPAHQLRADLQTIGLAVQVKRQRRQSHRMQLNGTGVKNSDLKGATESKESAPDKTQSNVEKQGGSGLWICLSGFESCLPAIVFQSLQTWIIE
jgi:hypothetical protein